jgi:hypothetical protein
MTTPSKRKGSKFENDLCVFLRLQGFNQAARTPAGATADRGDINGIPNWTIEAKNRKDIAAALRDGVDQAQAARTVTGTRYTCAIIKRPRQPMSAAYVVVTLEDWTQLVKDTQ